MAHIVIFPDHSSYERAVQALLDAETPFKALNPPRFCAGLVAPALRLSGKEGAGTALLRSLGVTISGVLPQRPFVSDVPDAAPPDSRWETVLGRLRIVSVRPDSTDPLRIWFKAVPERSLATLIPIMARMIRGGAYRREIPILAFEEEQRLLALSAHEMVISRAGDLLDAWIMLRSLVELILSAWTRRFSLEPETAPRNGIGAMEIFKRLPGDNCGRCKHENCMEFAMRLFMGRCRMEQCVTLGQREDPAGRESLRWVLCATGLDGVPGTMHYVTPEPPELARDTRLCARPPRTGEEAPAPCR